jgi:hypothetical protein
MSTLTDLEQRLTNVEQAVAKLQKQTVTHQDKGSWLDKVIGSVSDPEGFEQVLEYGREFRNADRARDDAGESS